MSSRGGCRGCVLGLLGGAVSVEVLGGGIAKLESPTDDLLTQILVALHRVSRAPEVVMLLPVVQSRYLIEASHKR